MKNTIFSKPQCNIIHQEYRIQSNIYHAHFCRPIFNRTRLLRIVYGSTYTRCRLRYRRNIQANPIWVVSFYSSRNTSDAFRVLRIWRCAIRSESPNLQNVYFNMYPSISIVWEMYINLYLEKYCDSKRKSTNIFISSIGHFFENFLNLKLDFNFIHL